MEFELWMKLGAVVGIACIVGGMFFMARRRGVLGFGGGSSRRVRVLETHPLEDKTKLVLLQWDDQEYMLVVGQQYTTHVSRTGGTPSPDRSDRPKPEAYHPYLKDLGRG